MKRRGERRPDEPLMIRAGSGLGDSLYLQAIVRHFVLNRGETGVVVYSKWSDVFLPIHRSITIRSFAERNNANRVAHYVNRKLIDETDQFVDMCLNAAVPEPVDLRLDWEAIDYDLVDAVRGDDARPVIGVLMPRRPMDRSDGFGAELFPNCDALQAAVDALRRRARLVLFGSGTPLYDVAGCHLDMSNKTPAVRDLIDLAWSCDGFVGQVSFVVPLAESLLKPLLAVWSRRGLNADNPFLSRITPAKVLHRKETSRAVIDDAPLVEIQEGANALFEQARSGYAIRRQAGRHSRERPEFARQRTWTY